MVNNISVIEKILKEYFDSKRFDEYKKLLSNINKSGKKKDDVGKKLKEISLKSELNSSTDYNTYIEFLLSFSEQNLSSAKYLELLLFLGEVSTIKGELDVSSRIFNKLIDFSIKKDKYKNVLAFALMSLGDIYSRQAEWEKSKNYIIKAKNIYKHENDYKGLAKCENLMGTIFGDKGNLNKAHKHFDLSLSYLNPKKDKTIYGMIESNLGVVNNILQNYDEAFNYYQRALIIFEKEKNYRRIAEVTGNIGVLYLEKGNYISALKEFDRSFAVSQKAGVLNPICVALLNKALIYTKLNDFKLANVFADKAMEIGYKINDKMSIADIYKIKGIIESNLKNYVLAENHLNTSLRMNIELENILNQAETYFELGHLFKTLKETKKSEFNFNESLKLYTNLKIKNKINDIKSELKSLKSN
ncbi:MAG: hypothetical protein CO128_03065 [Ignavibacteriales bacterium CG_4_9_14_3_um_filter_30_11]|nr:MAG: hypothetical protein CO128_03065 [Ignavibacteriales bacterium CG_4_9_14_3_um_filter_30_11]